MPFHFATAPLNFQRFLDLTRSGSRSLSPENELRQMTASSLPSFPTKQGGLSSPSTANPSETRSAQPRQPPHTHLSEFHTFPKASSSSVEKDSFDSKENALLKYTTEVREKCLKSYDFVEVESSESTQSEVMNDLMEAFRTSSLWQCGSPFYYPVTDQFYCWNLHPLRLKSKNEYYGMEGISCDFCGYTEWLAASDGPASNSAPLARRTTSSRKSRDVSNTEAFNPPMPSKSQPKSVKEETALEKEKPCPSFYHCAVCQVDLCAACIAEIRSDESYHAPCQECLRCTAYLSLQQAPAHRCRALEPTAPAVSVKKEEAEGDKMPGKAFTSRARCVDPEEDLLFTPDGSIECRTRTRKRSKTQREADLLTDSPSSIQTPALRKSAPILSGSSSAGPGLIKMSITSFPLKPWRSMGAGADAAATHSTGGATQKRRSLASKRAPEPESGWEVCITASTADEMMQAERIIEEMSMQPVQRKINAMRETLYLFKTSTRLASENCARVAREAGLLASLRKF